MVDDADLTVQQLALVSAGEVLKDIIPSYRIRPPTEAELQVKVPACCVYVFVLVCFLCAVCVCVDAVPLAAMCEKTQDSIVRAWV